jgi:hypothetical protein
LHLIALLSQQAAFGTFRGAELVAATRENGNFEKWRRGWDYPDCVGLCK